MRLLLTTVPALAWPWRVLLLMALSVAIAPISQAAKPNILFIAVDDLRPYMGCYDTEWIQTPNMDRLAESGMVFDRAYCQYPLCGPSRVSMMTGVRPDQSGIYDLHERLSQERPDLISLSSHLKQNGYRTAGIGKIYHNQDDDTDSWSEGLAFKHTLFADPNTQGKPATECADLPDEAYADCEIADLAVAQLAALSARQEPFFLAVGFHKPHLPFACPQKYWDLYPRDQFDLFEWSEPATGSELRGYSDVPGQGKIPDEQKRELIHGYAACVSFVDAQVGKLLDQVDRLGLADNTIIVLWGDHGFHLGENNHWGKHRAWETASRSPLIFAGPGISPGTVTEALTEFIDVYPTLCALAGLPVPDQCNGVSLLPVLRNPEAHVKEAAFTQYPDYNRDAMTYSMRKDRYRLYVNASFLDHTQEESVRLYDLVNDPLENHDLAQDPAMRETRDALLAEFHQSDARREPMCDLIQQRIGKFILKRKQKGFSIRWEKAE